MKLIALGVLLVAGSTNVTHAQLPQLAQIASLAKPTATIPKLNPKRMPRIALRIYDLDRVEPAVRAEASEVASEIFRKAGLEAEWVECPTEQRCSADDEGPEFRLRILPASLGKDMVSHDALGFAMPCAPTEEACLFYIFSWRIRALAVSNHLAAGRILGHVLAHEVGHTLLGPNAHSPYGVMQHNLPLRQMERILYFTSDQAKKLRAELLTRDAAMTVRYGLRRFPGAPEFDEKRGSPACGKYQKPQEAL